MQKVKEMINYFGTKNTVLLAILIGLLILNFVVAANTGIWFMNPFNPITWKGIYFKLRIFYGLLGGLSGYLFSILAENILNK